VKHPDLLLQHQYKTLEIYVCNMLFLHKHLPAASANGGLSVRGGHSVLASGAELVGNAELGGGA
jgi:hypothetical protein